MVIQNLMVCLSWGLLAPIALLSGGSVLAQEPTSQTGREYSIPRSTVHDIHSDILGRDYQLYVKLPPEYGEDKNARRKYPVAFLNDGPYAFQLASGVTHAAINRGAMESHILIGISYSPDDKPWESRRRDYTPKLENNPTGQAQEYLQFLREEVFPLTERLYRINNMRRAYVGYSLGGIFGIYTLLNAPESFRYYLISSPSLWFGNRWAIGREQKYADNHKDLSAEVFFSVGGHEKPAAKGEDYNKPTPINMVFDLDQFYKNLASRKYQSLRLKKYKVANAHHELALPTALSQGLYWLFPGEKYQ